MRVGLSRVQADYGNKGSQFIKRILYTQIMRRTRVRLSRGYCIHRLRGEQGESDYQEATVYTDYEENKESQIIKRILYTQIMRRTRVRLSRGYCIHRLRGEQGESDYQEATVYTDL